MNAVLKISEKNPSRHLINVKDYYALWEMGRLEQRVELIAGDIYDMAPMGSRHAGITNLLGMMLRKACGDRVMINTQTPIRLDEYSEPEPDICLLKGVGEDYLDRLPNADDVLVLIEVSDTTLKYDLEIKAGLYAQHKIPIYWVIDLKNKQLIIHSQAENTAYSHIQILEAHQLMNIEILPETFISFGQYLK